MGVPVITLAGRAHAGRVGVSLLSNLGLAEWVAQTREDYISRATLLSEDLVRLAAMRETLRSRMEASPLCNGVAFADRMEQAYRAVWKIWCDSGSGEVRKEETES